MAEKMKQGNYKEGKTLYKTRYRSARIRTDIDYKQHLNRLGRKYTNKNREDNREAYNKYMKDWWRSHAPGQRKLTIYGEQ